MKKIYTIFLLLLSFSLFSQTNVKEDSKGGVYFRQVGEKIEVWSGYPSDQAGKGYFFRAGENAETLEVVASNSKGGVSATAFSSPNDVVVVQDAAGNRYWKTIDGTVVKSEIVAASSSAIPAKRLVPAKIEESAVTQPELVEKAPVVVAEEEKEILVEVEESVAETPIVEINEPTVTEETPIEISEAQPEITVEESKEIIPLTEQAVSEEIIVTEIAENPVQDSPTVVVEEVTAPAELNKEFVTSPSPEFVEIEEPIVIAPEDESIRISKEEVGNVSDLFEKNIEDMTRKEKKLYKKNERKIMKQLEKELKKGNEEIES